MAERSCRRPCRNGDHYGQCADVTAAYFDRADARFRAVAARANQVLADCTRVLVPLAGWPREGECFACGRVPDVRVSMRLDDVEMFWAYACELHHDDPVTITISPV